MVLQVSSHLNRPGCLFLVSQQTQRELDHRSCFKWTAYHISGRTGETGAYTLDVRSKLYWHTKFSIINNVKKIKAVYKTVRTMWPHFSKQTYTHVHTHKKTKKNLVLYFLVIHFPISIVDNTDNNTALKIIGVGDGELVQSVSTCHTTLSTEFRVLVSTRQPLTNICDSTATQRRQANPEVHWPESLQLPWDPVSK